MRILSVDTAPTVQAFRLGDGFEAQGLRAPAAVLDPFLMVDHYWMSQPTFGPHPHAGLSAVTYMFDDAETGFRNRDSRGDDSVIRPGDAHWTVAGSGVVHDEVPLQPGLRAHGLQIFVNLAAADKHRLPSALHLLRDDMPHFRQAEGAEVKLAFGRYDDGARKLAHGAALPTDVTLLDLRFEAGTAFHYPVPEDHTALLLSVRGELTVGDQALPAGSALAFSRSGGLLQARALAASQAVLLMGRPHREPVHQRGPFAMASAADLTQAFADFQTGRMGQLTPIDAQ